MTQAFVISNSQAKRAQVENGMLDRILKLPTRVSTIATQSRMRTRGILDPQRTLKIDRGGETPGESPDRLVRLVYKLVKSLTKTSNKVREPLTHDEVINNPFYGNR